jgi:hypothetical protein
MKNGERTRNKNTSGKERCKKYKKLIISCSSPFLPRVLRFRGDLPKSLANIFLQMHKTIGGTFVQT